MDPVSRFHALVGATSSSDFCCNETRSWALPSREVDSSLRPAARARGETRWRLLAIRNARALPDIRCPCPTTTGNRCRSGAASRALWSARRRFRLPAPDRPLRRLATPRSRTEHGPNDPEPRILRERRASPNSIVVRAPLGHRDGRAGAGGRPTRRTSRPKTASPPFPPRRGSGFGAVEVLFIATRSFASTRDCSPVGSSGTRLALSRRRGNRDSGPRRLFHRSAAFFELRG